MSVITATILLLPLIGTGLLQAGDVPAEPDVEGCAYSDPQRTREPNPILFIGSSSIAHWDDLARDVGENAVRCGYSGDQTHDMIARARPVAERYHPRRIFYYAGDNDVADRGDAEHPRTPKSPAELVANFKAFVDQVRAVPGMSHVPISFLSIKESPARWGIRKRIVEANLAVCRHTDRDPDLDFIDVFDALLSDDRTAPNCSLFDRRDGPSPLHLSESGYRKWGDIIRHWMGPGQRYVTFHGCAWLDDLSRVALPEGDPYACFPN